MRSRRVYALSTSASSTEFLSSLVGLDRHRARYCPLVSHRSEDYFPCRSSRENTTFRFHCLGLWRRSRGGSLRPVRPGCVFHSAINQQKTARRLTLIISRRTLTEPKTTLAGVILAISFAGFKASTAIFTTVPRQHLPLLRPSRLGFHGSGGERNVWSGGCKDRPGSQPR